VYGFRALYKKKIKKTLKKELTQTNSLDTMYKCLRERDAKATTTQGFRTKKTIYLFESQYTIKGLR